MLAGGVVHASLPKIYWKGGGRGVCTVHMQDDRVLSSLAVVQPGTERHNRIHKKTTGEA